jgi:fatty acid desaturase
MVKKNKLFSKMKERNDKVSKDMEDKIPSSVLGKVIYGVLTLIVVILLIAFSTSIIWLPITMWIYFSWQSGLIAFMLISAILSLLLIVIYVKLVPGYVIKEGAIVKETNY